MEPDTIAIHGSAGVETANTNGCHAGSDDGLAAFLSVRPRLFAIACRMLGDAAEAEDVVQDVWMRWQTTDRSLVRSAPAFLVTTVSRLAINVLRSARSRRELDNDPALPEPVDTHPGPPADAERGQELASGVRLLVETLSAAERAAYILREAFDYPYREIARTLRMEEANARQLVSRARQRLALGRRRDDSGVADGRRLLEAFMAAAQHGELPQLEGVLRLDVMLFASRRGLMRAA